VKECQNTCRCVVVAQKYLTVCRTWKITLTNNFSTRTRNLTTSAEQTFLSVTVVSDILGATKVTKNIFDGFPNRPRVLEGNLQSSV